jgi:hypothetical protein
MTTQERLQTLFTYTDGMLYRKQSRGSAKAGSPLNTMHRSGYLSGKVDGKRYLLHRLIFLFHHGYLPKLLDHKDRNPLNNRIENLREATHQQNASNRKNQTNNKSGVRGVHWKARNKKWQAQVKLNGKHQYLGLFTDLAEAEQAVKQFRSEQYKEFA